MSVNASNELRRDNDFFVKKKFTSRFVSSSCAVYSFGEVSLSPYTSWDNLVSIDAGAAAATAAAATAAAVVLIFCLSET